jgi:DNA helicase-2/ATP-dependent DNA helicase PcrA
MEVFDLLLRILINPSDLYHIKLLSRLLSINLVIDTNYGDLHKYIESILNQTKYSWLNSAFQYISSEGVVNFDKALDALKENIPSDLLTDERDLLEKDIYEWQKHWDKFKSYVSNIDRRLTVFRNQLSMGQTQAIGSKTGIALLTAPMANGLEFEVVFVIGLTEGTFPDYRAVNSTNSKAMIQEINYMHIAVTCAKRLCYLSYPQRRKMFWGEDKMQEPSRFICQALSSHASAYAEPA